MTIDEKLKSLGIVLPEAPARMGVYMPVKLFGGHAGGHTDGHVGGHVGGQTGGSVGDNLAYTSGVGPNTADQTYAGCVGREYTLEEGRKAAESCMLNILAILKRDLGSLDEIARFVKMTVFVASDNDFAQQPQVANAATELLVNIFGEEVGCPSRSAVGVNVLPGKIPVEIEVLVMLRDTAV